MATSEKQPGSGRLSIERFEGQAEQYLQELHQQLKTGTYQPQAVKRVCGDNYLGRFDDNYLVRLTDM